MKLSNTCILAALLLFGATSHLRAELFSVVEATDLRGNVAFQICTESDKLKIESELNAEARAYPKALEATKAEWQKNHAESAFPNGRLKQRTLRVLSTTINREEADKLLAQNKGRETRTLANEKAEKERVLDAKPARFRRGANAAELEQQKREIKEKSERDALADKAEAILRQKLTEAVKHEIPFYGATPEEPKKAAKKKK